MGTQVFVKTHLRSQILRRRQEHGLGDIDVDFSPKPSQPLTPEEREKEKKRKESNRRSAWKSRQKVKALDKTNNKILEEETARKHQLLNKLNTLENDKHKEVLRLRNLGIPELTIKAALAQTLLEWKNLIARHTNEINDLKRPDERQSHESSSAVSSNYSSDSDSYATPTGSNESSGASSPSYAYSPSDCGPSPLYSFESRTAYSSQSAFSTHADQGRHIQDGQRMMPNEAEDVLMNLEALTPVSLETVSYIVNEDSDGCLFDDSMCLGNSGDFMMQGNSLSGFQIRQALMCM